MTITFCLADISADAELALADFDDLDDLRDAIQAEFEEATHCRINLCTAGRPAIALPEVFQVLVDELDNAETDVSVECIVSSQRVIDHLHRYLPGEDRESTRVTLNSLKITVMTGDITGVVAEAVVNASNTRLVLGGGVSGALRRACGPRLQPAMHQVGGLTIDGLAATPAFDLQTTDRIIHVPTANGNAQTIATAMRNILRYCEAHSIRSVAIPGLGMGTGGLDATQCAGICATALSAFTEGHGSRALRHVIFVLWTATDYQAFESVFANLGDS